MRDGVPTTASLGGSRSAEIIERLGRLIRCERVYEAAPGTAVEIRGLSC
jgi:hypothetical protein